ncbi:MAG: RnfABCDGE type electron transport complex subunit D [Bacilli bacterium]|nr:RnfABCDGE type electron transport complex subunit D [Bacilli bacterium]
MNKNFFDNNKVLTSNLVWFISLLPVLMFTSYKNGFLLASGGFFKTINAFYYLYVPILIIIFSYLFEFIYYKLFKKSNLVNRVVNSSLPLFNVLCFLTMGPNVNIFVIVGVIFLVSLLSKLVKVNYICLFKLIVFLILMFYGSVSNANILQSTYNNDFGYLDLFIGFGISDIGNSTLFILCGYLILCFDSTYKKDIPIISLLVYILFSLFLCYINKFTLNNLMINTFNSSLLFILVYVASVSIYSPVTFKQKLIYSILIGIVASIVINLLNMVILLYLFIFLYSIYLCVFNKKYK